MPDLSSPAPAPAPLKLEHVIYALNHITRWHILKELLSGEPRMVNELAAAVRKPANSVSKHVIALHNVGVVERTRHSYRLAPRFVSRTGRPEIDFGHCVVRFDV